MATGPDWLITNPWLVPFEYWAWEAFQSWAGLSVSWQTLGMWKECTRSPCPSGLVAEGAPPGPSLSPSPRPRVPRMLSNEWFSIITTTM